MSKVLDSKAARSVAAAVGAGVLLAGAVGCGGASDGDKQVCDLAYADDEEAVGAAAQAADDDDLAEQAAKIGPGSDAEAENKVMDEVRAICADLGYTEQDSQKSDGS